jgi:hypothetical protein
MCHQASEPLSQLIMEPGILPTIHSTTTRIQAILVLFSRLHYAQGSQTTETDLSQRNAANTFPPTHELGGKKEASKRRRYAYHMCRNKKNKV